MGKRRRQEDDGRDARKKSKVQDRKGILKKRLKTMTVDDIATFVDEVFSTIEILCGMMDQSRAAVVRSSIQPIVMGLSATVIDLTMLDDPAADDLGYPPAPVIPIQFYPQDLQLPSGATVQIPNNYSNTLFTASDVARYRKDRKIVASLDKLLSRERCQPTPISQRLHAGYASSHPTISPDSQALLIGMARYTFMLELQSVMKDIDPNKKRMLIATKGNERWSSWNKCNMEMVLRSSPSASAIDDWVVRLALEQAMIASTFFQNCGAVYLMSDGGHKGSQVKLLSRWDKHNTSQTPDGSIRTIILDIDASGKKPEDVATGCVYSLEKIGIENIDGLANDSGAGTPKSLQAELVKENKMVEAVALFQNLVDFMTSKVSSVFQYGTTWVTAALIIITQCN
jgi:hypothetical protein